MLAKHNSMCRGNRAAPVTENGGDLRIGQFVTGYLEQHERHDSPMGGPGTNAAEHQISVGGPVRLSLRLETLLQ
jgi:hypothetical protein